MDKNEMRWTEEEWREALRKLPPPDLINLHCVQGPHAPDMPRIDVSNWSIEKLTNAIMGPFADSAIEELTRRANAEHVTVADILYADIRKRFGDKETF